MLGSDEASDTDDGQTMGALVAAEQYVQDLIDLAAVDPSPIGCHRSASLI
jgi:hypothetical protein